MAERHDLREKIEAELARLFEDHDQWGEKECERYLELEARYPQETAEDARTMVWLISKAYLKSGELMMAGKVQWDGYSLKLGTPRSRSKAARGMPDVSGDADRESS